VLVVSDLLASVESLQSLVTSLEAEGLAKDALLTALEAKAAVLTASPDAFIVAAPHRVQVVFFLL
jgi:hypothetical protein